MQKAGKSFIVSINGLFLKMTDKYASKYKFMNFFCFKKLKLR